MFKKSGINIKAIFPLLKSVLIRRGDYAAKASETPKIQSLTMPILSPQKQQELDLLCQQLFKKKELIASGKLQLIGLEKIKNQMGPRWEKLCTTVYATAEDVIKEHVGKGDFFIRYKGDSYVIVFAYASRPEAQTKTEMIVKEIKRRLFSLNEADLKGIEVKGTVTEVSSKQFDRQGFPDVLEHAFSGAAENTGKEPTSKSDHHTRVYSNLDLSKETEASPKELGLDHVYTPLWDVARGALTTYLCMPKVAAPGENNFEACLDSYNNKSSVAKVEMDLKILETVIGELVSMEQDNRKLYVICPVHKETLSHLEDFHAYKELCQKIPVEQRKFLIFMIVDMPDGLSLKEPYKFVAPLKNFSAHVYARNMLGNKINFQILKDSGIDGVGVVAFHKNRPETKTMDLLNAFCADAQKAKISKTFVLDIASLSLTTSSVCAGFSYLGGLGIHEDVEKPDHVYRYKHEDLISGLLQK